MNDDRKLLEGLKPCPRCHSTEHLHIEIVDDCLPDELSAKVCCTECHIFAQRHYIFNGTTNDGRPSDVQLTREVIEQWNETCDDWEWMSDHDMAAMPSSRTVDIGAASCSRSGAATKTSA